MYILVIICLISIVRTSWKESTSILTNTSKNLTKKEAFSNEYQFISTNINANDNAQIITNNIWAMPLNVYFNKMPNYIVLDNSILNFDPEKKDLLSGQPEIDYSELNKIQKPYYIIFNYPSARTSKAAYDIVNNTGKRIYKNRNILIYYIK